MLNCQCWPDEREVAANQQEEAIWVRVRAYEFTRAVQSACTKGGKQILMRDKDGKAMMLTSSCLGRSQK